jgi:hypothetical protein
MSIFQIEEAQREGARLVIGLVGISGGGKTRTALEIAHGLANYDAKKIGFICTENKRGRLYSDCLVKPDTGEVDRFLIGDLVAPFSPQRYIDAIQAFEKAGVEVLVIDSGSHEWEGIGGCEDIANAPGHDGKPPRNPAWNRAKAEHKRFMNVLLQSPMHIIVCLRAREKTKQAMDGGKLKIESIGVQPICEKNFTFELTASLMMWNGGRSQQILKVPDELMPILGRQEGYITAADGAALRAWVDGAKQLDPEVERARSNLNVVCEQGMDALSAAWGKLPKAIKKAIGETGLETLKKSASAFDAQRTTPEAAGLEDLNAEVGGQAA